MNTTASSARARSASSNTITGFLPPSSKCTRFSVGALQPVTLEWKPGEYADAGEAELFYDEFQRQRTLRTKA